MVEMVRTGLRDWIHQDVAANTEGKSRFVLRGFRLAQRARAGSTPLPRPLERLIDRGYRDLTGWFMATELHPDVQAGPGLRIFHCHNVVLNPGARLGARCTLRTGVCLGNLTDRDGSESGSPELGDEVDVGAGALILGPVRVGHRARIGAGAVVVRDVPDGATAVGNPARIL
ncbi:MAG: serine O-acetyltransferase [Solirubrobacteraceae bacterium]|jgi:putative colanic acid biosynthesis acetyltransferase WcaB|nr:serine O-acetyltransferase [Solirubrobacteraceae bacterium]